MAMYKSSYKPNTPLIALILASLFACGKEQVQVPVNKIEPEQVKENLLEMNKQFYELEEQEINHYIDSLHLEMSRTSSGLRYHIIEKGAGDSIVGDDEVTIKYTIGPLGEEPCDKITDVVTTVKIGHTDIEKGIREAIPLMRNGGSGEFILPSVIAFGVPGKGKCINSWTPVFMKMAILEVKSGN